MIKRNKILIIVLIVLLLAFFFPKKSGTWWVSRDEDHYCKCLGIEKIFGFPVKSNKPGNSLCFGIPYACGDAGYNHYIEFMDFDILNR